MLLMRTDEKRVILQMIINAEWIPMVRGRTKNPQRCTDMCSYSRWCGSEHELLLVDKHLNLVGTIDLILLR